METFVINPDTSQPVSLAEWAKDKDPKRATLLLLKTKEYSLIITKNHIADGKELTFDEAQKAAEAFHPKGYDGKTFRCPARKECLDLYDARFEGGLDKALELVGGEPMRGWIWTCERDKDPRSNAYGAWFFNQSYGTLNGNYVYSAYRCRAALLL